MRIYLIGYMGCGKSTLGRRLSKYLNLQFIDMDHYIEERNYKTIPQIFAEEGESEFRKKERKALEELSGYPKPDLAYVQLGADPYENDGLASTDLLKLTLEQMNERNRIIYRFLEERKIPATYIMSGGYGERAWEPYPDFLIRALLDRLG